MEMIKCSCGLFVPGVLSLALVMACTSQYPAFQPDSIKTAGGLAQPFSAPVSDSANPSYTEKGVSLDEALADIAAYYMDHLPANTNIALLTVESDAQALSDYIFEELWIHFEDSRSFALVDRRNLELIQRELEYQYSGNVSEESAQSIGKQFGAQTLVYGKMTRLGGEYRLVIHATDVERAVTSIRAAAVIPNPRFAALLEAPKGGAAEVNLANALYSGAGNPWRFTAQTDRVGGDYRDGDYMTLRIYSEKDAWFKITHIDVYGDTQVIYPLSPRDNNFIRAGETRQIPDNTRFRMTKPYGEEMILVGAYETPFVVQWNSTAPLSNNSLVRGITVEREDAAIMRPVATAKCAYRIAP